MVDPKIGLELEFYRDDIQGFDVFSDSSLYKMGDLYKGFILKWIEEYEKRFRNKIFEVYKEDLKSKPLDFTIYRFNESRKKVTGHKTQVFKQYFQFQVFSFNRLDPSETVSYCITPTLDPRCVEIVATPLKVSEYKYEGFKKILSYFLFEIMKNLGFSTVYKTMQVNRAAGHLNIDYKTGFDSELSKVLSLMRYIDNLYEDDVCKYLKILRSNYIDPWNSLYIGDLDPMSNNKDAITRIRKAYAAALEKVKDRNDLKGLMEQVRALYLKIPNISNINVDSIMPAEYIKDENIKTFKKLYPETFKNYYTLNQDKRKFVLSLINEANTAREDALNSLLNNDKELVEYILSDENSLTNAVDIRIITNQSDTWTEHYMAINTESFDNTSKKAIRVELRAVVMPNDYDELLAQVNCVQEILEITNK